MRVLTYGPPTGNVDHNRKLAAELAAWNRTLEARVAEQLLEIERIGRLRRFLSAQSGRKAKYAELFVEAMELDEGMLQWGLRAAAMRVGFLPVRAGMGSDLMKANPDLIPNMVSEIIRWQTPLAYMRRIAKADTVLNGQFIRKGDKVVMWYASGNRDERQFENPDEFIIDRANARNHMSFGFGVHRCMGNRLAEMQLRILWEELLTRFEKIEVLSEPELVQSNFVRGYEKMMVQLTPVAEPPAAKRPATRDKVKA